MKSKILENKWATEEELKATDKKIKDEVMECVKFAEESPYHDASEAYKDVYVQEDYPFITE